MAQGDTQDEATVRELAQSLDCFTDGEVQALGKLKPGSLEAWQKRGTGPSYILFGNRYLYPRKAIADFLATKVRERRPTPVGGQL